MIATQTDWGYDLAMTRGDTDALTVTMTIEQGGTEVPFDATAAVMTVRTSRTGGELFSLSPTTLTNGVAVFDFAPSLTAGLTAGDYVYDIQATTSDGVVKTPLGGLQKPCRFTIYQDVTYGGA